MKEPYKVWLLNMKQSKIYKTYNHITKLFDVTIMSKQQINKLNNRQGFLVATPKKHIDVVKPPKPPKPKQPTLRELILSIDKRLTQIVQANNLIDPGIKNKQSI